MDAFGQGIMDPFGMLSSDTADEQDDENDDAPDLLAADVLRSWGLNIAVADVPVLKLPEPIIYLIMHGQ